MTTMAQAKEKRVGGKLSRRRGVLFVAVALEAITWPGGEVVVNAGEVGLAVLAWGGAEPGYFVEWSGGMCIGVERATEGQTWRRVDVFFDSRGNDNKMGRAQ